MVFFLIPHWMEYPNRLFIAKGILDPCDRSVPARCVAFRFLSRNCVVVVQACGCTERKNYQEFGWEFPAKGPCGISIRCIRVSHQRFADCVRSTELHEEQGPWRKH